MRKPTDRATNHFPQSGMFSLIFGGLTTRLWIRRPHAAQSRESLGQSLHYLQVTFDFQKAQQLDNFWSIDLPEVCSAKRWKDMQRNLAPDVLGIGRGDRIFFQLKPGQRHDLECVLGCLPFCLLQLATLFFRVDVLG